MAEWNLVVGRVHFPPHFWAILIVSVLCLCHTSQALRVEMTPLLEGDVNIVAMLRMHPEESASSAACRRILTHQGIQLASALYYAVERINSNSEILPRLRLGVTIMDVSCDNSPSTMRDALGYITGPRGSGLPWAFLPVINGLSISDPVYGSVTQMLEVLDIPQVFLEPDKDGLGVSVLPSRRMVAHALFDIIRAFEMPEFLVVVEDGENGGDWQGVLDELRGNLLSYTGSVSPEHMCLRETAPLRLPADSSEANQKVRRFVESLPEEGRRHATIVLLCGERLTEQIFSAAQALNITQRQWILPHASAAFRSSTSDSFLAQDVILAQDMRGQGQSVPGFLNFLTTAAQRSLAQSQSDWIGLFVRQQRHWCMWSKNFTSEQMTICKGIVSNPPGFLQHALASPAIDAINLVASAIDTLRGMYCSLAARPLTRARCPIKNFKPMPGLYASAVRNATTLSSVNETITFQEAFQAFHVPHFQISRKRPGTVNFQLLTDWKVQSIMENAIRRSISTADIQSLKDSCRPECGAGEYPRRVEHGTDEAGKSLGECEARCFTCESCTDQTFGLNENEQQCKQCPEGTTASEDNSDCVPMTLDVLRWTDASAIALVVLSGLGVFVLLVIAVTLLRLHYLGDLEDQHLLVLCIASLLLVAAVPFNNLLPSVATCSLRFILRHVLFALFAAALALYARSRAEGDGPPQAESVLSIVDYGALLGAAILSLIFALICLVTRPAIAEYLRVTLTHEELTCRYSTPMMVVMTTLSGLVCLAALVYSVLVWRRLGTALLAVATLTSLAMWLAMNLVRHYSSGASNQIPDCCHGVVVAYVTLILVILPNVVMLNRQESETDTVSPASRQFPPTQFRPQQRNQQQQQRPQKVPRAHLKKGPLRKLSIHVIPPQSERSPKLSYENDLPMPNPSYMLAGHPNNPDATKGTKDYSFFHGVAGRHVKFDLEEEVASMRDYGGAPDRPPSPMQFSSTFAAEPPIYSNPGEILVVAPQPTPRQLVGARKSKPPPPTGPPPESEYAS